jgi:diphosphomevalonate decarboxylase
MMSNTQYQAEWTAPSNIALVKYWGKKGFQLPTNPSVSFSLNNATTTTRVVLSEKTNADEISMDFTFEGKRQEGFQSKLHGFLLKAAEYFTWLKTSHLYISSSNNFPHSSGIASSASSYSAIALCLCDLHKQMNPNQSFDFYQLASFWARIGSGSACRSVYGGYNVWGQLNGLDRSSDDYAINIDHQIHPIYKDFKDTILIVEKGKKSVSSTAGHALLKEHPFAALRYQTAFENMHKMLKILQSGDLEDFINLVEHEALMLHSLMMSSPTPFILMKPNTLAILEKIKDFRNQTGLPLLFTLDAGANVHLLNSYESDEKVQKFIQNDLVGYCENEMYLCNAVGNGPSASTKA